MKKPLSLLLALCILFAALLPASAEESGPRLVTCVFQAAMSPLMHYDVLYDDAVFKKDSGIYDHALCRMSLGMALSAFRPESLEEDQAVNIVSFMEQAGMENIRVDQYGVITDENTIGTTLGTKRIGTGEDAFTLVAAAVCGGRYRNEWLSNFKVADPVTGEVSTHHLGFYEASCKVAERIRDYTRDMEGPIKLWITGYSRGAAVSNLSAALCVQEGLILPGNVFAYSFATPTNTRDADAHSDAYRGLYCITGMFDAVPQVPLIRWGFTRYGTTLTLPSAETDALYYGQFYWKADEWSQKHLDIPFYNTTFANYTVTKILETLGAVMPTAEDYGTKLQGKMIEVWKEKGNMLALVQLISDIYEEASSEDDGWALSDLLSESAWQGVLQWAGQSWLDVSSDHTVAQNLGREHFPDCYVSLLMSCEAEDLFKEDRGYMRISIPKGTTLTIADVDALETGYSLETASSTFTGNGSEDSFWPVITLSEGCVVSLPLGESYMMTLRADEDSSPLLVFQEYHAGEVPVREQLLSFETRDGAEIWHALLDLRENDPDRVIQFYHSDRTNTAFRTDGMFQAGLLDLLFITGSSPSGSLQTAAIALGVIVTLLLAVLILAMVWAIRGRTRKASVTLFILLGVLFVLIHLSANLLPAQAGFRAVFKGMATATVLLQCLLCALQKKSRRNVLVLIGMLLYIVNDVVINLDFTAGLAASFAGNAFFIAGFLSDNKPERKQALIAALLPLAAGLALLYVWREEPDVEDHLWPMLVYLLPVCVLSAAARGQNRLIRTAVVLLILADVTILYNQVQGTLWWTYVLSLGLYYAAMSLLALGVKDGAHLPSVSARGQRRLLRKQEKKTRRQGGEQA